LNPNYAIEWTLGKIYQCLEEIDLSAKHFKNSYDLEPANVDVARETSLAFLNKCDYETAIYYINKAIELENKNAGLYCNKALIYILKKQDDKALKLINKALELNPKDQITKHVKKLIVNIMDDKDSRPKHPAEFVKILK